MEQQILQEQKKPNMLAFQTAISFALYILALTFVMRLLKIDPQAQNVPITQTIITTLLTYAPFVFAIYFVQNKHKQDLGGYITFGRAFSAGFKVAVYSGLFTAFLLVIYYKILDPAALTEMLDNAIAKAGDDENQQKGIEMMSKYMVVFLVFGVAVAFTFFGLIISLISAAIIKRERPLHLDNAAE